MDGWSQRFSQHAVFSAPYESVLAAARATPPAALGALEEAADGFVTSGSSGGHPVRAVCHAEAVTNGTRLTLELQVARAGRWGFMLTDVGGYYEMLLHRWLTRIGRQLGQPALARSQPPLQQSCLAGCAVYLVAGTGLALLALPLDRLVLLPRGSPLPGPATLAASGLGLLAGLAAFFYGRFPRREP